MKAAAGAAPYGAAFQRLPRTAWFDQFLCPQGAPDPRSATGWLPQHAGVLVPLVGRLFSIANTGGFRQVRSSACYQ